MRKINLLALPTVKVSRWYLSLDYYWEVVGIAIFPGAYTEAINYQFTIYRNIEGTTLYVKWLLIKFAAFGIFYVFLKLMSQFLKLNGIKALKIWQIVPIATIGGLFSGGAQDYLLKILDLPDLGTSFARFTGPIPICILLVLGLSILKSTVRKYRVQQEIAQIEIDNLVALQASQRQFLGGYAELAEGVEVAVSASTSDAIGQIGALNTTEDPMDASIAQKIRLINDSTIRDLAHQIEYSYIGFETEKKSTVSIGLNALRILRESLNFMPLNPLAFSFGVAFLTFGSLVRHANAYQATFMTLSVFSALFAIQYLGVLFYRIFKIQNTFTAFALLSINCIVPTILVRQLEIEKILPDTSKFPPQVRPYIALLVMATIAGYLMQAGLLRSDDIMRTKKQVIKNNQIASAPINKELVQISRNWARHLHGRVQAQIMAATFSIENAQDQGDAVAVQMALDQIISTLENAIQIGGADSKTLTAAITGRSAQWAGILEIDLRISPEIAQRSGVEVLTIADVIEEMISNASRHGAATKIRIEVERRNPTQVIIRAIDNGVHFNNESTGFGSRFFEEVSQGRWDITRNSTFAETTVSVLVELEGNYSFQHHTLAPSADFYRP